MQNVNCGIDHIPQEMLENIFSYLTPRDLQASSQVCKRWNSILDQDRYIKKKTLLVQPSTLCSLRSLESIMRPFRKIHIVYKESEEGHRWRIFLDRVQELLKCIVMRKNLEVLRVSMSMENANRILTDLGKVLYKKLMKFTYTPENRSAVHEEIAPKFTFNAPRLKWLEIDCLSSSSRQLLEQRDFKFSQLTLYLYNIHRFYEALNKAKFRKLRELCIHSPRHFHERVRNGNDDHYKRVLKKLHGLEIRDGAGMFFDYYFNIFSDTAELRVLIVRGISMTRKCIWWCNHMQHLKTLELLVIGIDDSEVKLILPKLETLKMCPKFIVPAGNLPKLRILSIVNATYLPGTEVTGTFDDRAMDALNSYKQLTTIEEVHFQGVLIDEGLMSGFVSRPRIICHNSTITGRLVDSENQ